MKMLSGKVMELEGLDEGVIPLIPLKHTSSIAVVNQNTTVVRTQLTLTVAFAFTDYCSQGKQSTMQS
jgi:hypothetical protein